MLATCSQVIGDELRTNSLLFAYILIPVWTSAMMANPTMNLGGYQSSGCFLMKSAMSFSHSAFLRFTTSIACADKFSSAPRYVLFSPRTTRSMLYSMQAPVHISQGLSVVYMVAPLYAEAGNRPAASKAAISAYVHRLGNMNQHSYGEDLHVLLRCSSAHADCALCQVSAHLQIPVQLR